ncbi:SMAD/FHA domain-containing protein [Neolentinus lepideus HHB14362 ss-1]|uniref:SMAD/FHA domain-containing protein n=1 Tax=Neolentinus lepideus HHB14362 ss-1 TaxID=1314782 RepID=A0A165SY38_9AGAM|nr:SMAD/FHA domain-containing protein [Neolentinus lepideus HHB14362 ss-1]
MLRRRRSAGALASTATPQVAISASAPGLTSGPPRSAGASSSSNAPGHRIRLVPHIDSRRSLRFEPIQRDVKEGDIPLRIGRFTDRSGLGIAAANALGSNKLAFKSKVVSRSHAEIWVEIGGKFFIKDTKSSSGTFLNHVRLSPANSESRPHELKDGDILQLGVDYQGGAEDIYKCVKIRVEVGREWQAAANAFNTNALKQLKALSIPSTSKPSEPKKIAPKSGLSDCCICLFAITIQQALFIAPCSHSFHYKCIRPLLDSHHPAFSCPVCRTYADLEEDVEVDVESLVDSGDAGDADVVMDPAGAGITREREREDGAGAETEVEGDTGATRLGIGLPSRGRSGFQGSGSAPGRSATMVGSGYVVDLTEEDGEEMPLPPLPEDHDGDVQMSPSVSREGSLSPDPTGTSAVGEGSSSEAVAVVPMGMEMEIEEAESEERKKAVSRMR